jgi:hypothetical protein
MTFTRKIFPFLICSFLFCNFSTTRSDGEYPLKAAFLYRFIDYVEWSNNNNDPTFNIAILGGSPIVSSLNEIAANKLAKGKRMNIREYENLSDITSCQVLFVSKNARAPIETIISKMSDRPVLIVSEQNGFAQKGAHINFFFSESKLKFEVNIKSATRVGLKLSSQLLQHAVLVD